MNAVAWAQTDAAPAVPPPLSESTLRLDVAAGVWLPRLLGDVTLGPNGTKLDVQDDLGMDDLEPSFSGSLALGRGEWQVRVDGFDFSTAATTTFIAPGGAPAVYGPLILNTGDVISSSFDMTSFSAELGWWPLHPCECGKVMSNGELCKVDFRLGLLGGFRYLDIDQSVNQIGVGQVDTGGEWTVLHGGLMLDLFYDVKDIWPIVEAFEIYAAASAGPALGGDGGFMYQVRTGFLLHFTANASFMFGYQIVNIDAENGDFELNAGPQGLFIGGAVRF
jgi:hypothetical protein